MLGRQKTNSSMGVPSSMLFNQSILDVFVLQGILDLEDAEKLKGHFRTNREIETFLLANHLVTRDTINKAYSIILKLPFIELKNIKISPETLATVPEKIATRLGIIPFDLDGTLLKIAVTQPADLPLSFSQTVKKLFKSEKANLELFITGMDDFKEALKQYKDKPEKSLLIKKGSLPVVYLRNRKITRECLNKIPKSFIEKYRVLVFDENIAGHYLVACEHPDSSLTKKIFNYIEKENKVKLEIFATSESDIDYVLQNYDSDMPFQIEELQPKKEVEQGPSKKEQYKTIAQDNLRQVISGIKKTFFRRKNPTLTVDSIFSRPKNETGLARTEESKFPNNDKASIINNVEDKGNIEIKSINLVGKVPKDFLVKLPKEFISKYRVVVFGEDDKGKLMLATDTPDSDVTKKALDFIAGQHPTQIYATKPADIEYALNIYE